MGKISRLIIVFIGLFLLTSCLSSPHRSSNSYLNLIQSYHSDFSKYGGKKISLSYDNKGMYFEVYVEHPDGVDDAISLAKIVGYISSSLYDASFSKIGVNINRCDVVFTRDGEPFILLSSSRSITKSYTDGKMNIGQYAATITASKP